MTTGNQTGRVIIDGIAEHYYSMLTDETPLGYSLISVDYGSKKSPLELPSGTPTVKDRIIIDIVDDVDIVPKYKSVFLVSGNTYDFRVLHGSGKYRYKVNDTNIA